MLADFVDAEVLGLATPRNHDRIQRSAEGLGPSQDDGDRDAQDEELSGGPEEPVGVDDHAGSR